MKIASFESKPVCRVIGLMGIIIGIITTKGPKSAQLTLFLTVYYPFLYRYFHFQKVNFICIDQSSLLKIRLKIHSYEMNYVNHKALFQCRVDSQQGQREGTGRVHWQTQPYLQYQACLQMLTFGYLPKRSYWKSNPIQVKFTWVVINLQQPCRHTLFQDVSLFRSFWGKDTGIQALSALVCN